MTLTEAVILLKRMQESAVIGDTPNIEEFNKLDFIKKQIIEAQKPKKRKFKK